MLKSLFFISVNLCLLIAAVPTEPNGKAEGTKCGYESCAKLKSGVLNVHLVTHTHDDVGWLKTVDQYYYGSKGRIQKASVQYIIDSVIEALLEDPERRFVYVESAFFSKWWNEQSEEIKDQVRMLVNEGRLEFAGGAWSMNDEAASHYQSLVDQFTLGLQFLNETFGECGRPRVGWQIDPFGHSREQASLFTKMGFDGVFFSRLDWRDKWKRIDDKEMEMIWKSSGSLDDSDLFTGATYDHYYPPSGFCFDILCDDEPFIDDEGSFDNNVDRRVQEFVTYVEKQAKGYKTNNIMLTMGGDFFFMSAILWFKNLDKLIKHVNARQSDLKINVLYSTPACYLKALHDSNEKWPTKSDDFFPLGNDPHTYWTGYYTSRPTSKRFERVGNQFLQICKKLTATAKIAEDFYDSNLMRLKHMVGVMQHHDAITGTEKQHVADDYHRGLDASIVACEANTRSSLNQFVTGKEPTGASTEWELKFDSCLYLNISVCAVSENSQNFMLTVYNSLGYSTNQFVRFPVKGDNYEVRDPDNDLIASQIVSTPTSLIDLHYRDSKGSKELVFQAKGVPAVGYKSYYVSRVSSPSTVQITKRAAEPVTIGNDNLKISFDANGLLSDIIVDGVASKLSQNFLIYKGANMNNMIFANRSSGAYIFRPDPLLDLEVVGQGQVTLHVETGDQVDEVHQVFSEWISQVVRIYKTEKVVEFEWLVGPISISDGHGKEVVSRWTTDLKTDGIFYTDTNGREMLQRKRDFRATWDIDIDEPVSANYYPITAKIAIDDGVNRLAVLTDRAQGGSSIIDGTIELMVHRRLLNDDAFGVGEALNEMEHGDGLVARGKHWLIFGKKSTQNPTLEGSERLLQNRVLMSNWLFFDDVSSKNFDDWKLYTNKHSSIGAELPEHVYLMTFEPWNKNSFLIRFEHILEKNEDPELSKPVSFNLAAVFPGDFTFSEVTLAANQWIGDLNRLQFQAVGTSDVLEARVENAKSKVVSRAFLSNTEITLKPMEMRTFIMQVSHGIKSQTVFTFFWFIMIIMIIKNSI